MKRDRSIRWYPVLVLIMIVVATSAYAISYKQKDYYDAIISVADRLVALQFSDGSWPEDISGLFSPSGEHSTRINGIVTQSILHAYKLDNKNSYKDACLKTANWMVSFYQSNGFLHNEDAMALYDIGAQWDNSFYKDNASNAIKKVVEDLYPSNQALVNMLSDLQANISYKAATYIRAFNKFGYKQRALQLADYMVANWQAKSGLASGAFLSARDYKGSGLDYYLMKDSAYAALALSELDAARYYNAILRTTNLIISGYGFNGRTNYEGGYPAGFTYNPGENSWDYVDYLYTAEDQAYQVRFLSAVKERTYANAGCNFLVYTQELPEHGGGWETRTLGWDAPIDDTEYSYTDAAVVTALAERLKINRAPIILLAGYGYTSLSKNNGGFFEMLCWAQDLDEDSISSCEIYVNGQATGTMLTKEETVPGLFLFDTTTIYPGVQPQQVLLELRVTDELGKTSKSWPYMHISKLDDDLYGGLYTYQSEPEPWWLHYYRTIEMTTFEGKGAAKPNILAAGYMYTNLSEQSGGTLNLAAACDDRDSPRDIKDVQIYVAGMPSGIYLKDDGLSGDFAASDQVFGMQMNFTSASLQGASGQYIIELVATDYSGNKSNLWPYLVISQ